MRIFRLTEPVVAGDAVAQPIALARAGQDFTGLTAVAVLLRNDAPLSAPVPTVEITAAGAGSAAFIVRLTGDDTLALAETPPWDYAVRVRVATPGWGPLSVVQIGFAVKA